MPNDDMKILVSLQYNRASDDAVKRDIAKLKRELESQLNLRVDTSNRVQEQAQRSLTLERQKTEQVKLQLQIFKETQERAIRQLRSGTYGNFADTNALDDYRRRLNALTPETENVRGQMQLMRSELRNINQDAVEARTGLARLGETAVNSAKKFAEFYFLAGGIVAITKGLSDMVSTVYQLDNAMNQIRIVTGQSLEQVSGLAQQYNEFAKANSVTTLEVAKLNVELYRQGLAQEEVNNRLQATIKYSKISGLSVAESGVIITAAANGTKKDVNEIIDIFSNLGDKTAAGADTIGQAMQRVAGSAETAGYPFEQLAAHIATVASITQESAQTIGNSFKSLSARYGAIKETGFNEEDETKINDVTKALKSVGVTAVGTDGQLRPLGEVLDELGTKWTTLDGTTQKYVATALGGKIASLYSNI